jgi:hypothetical protein
VLAKLTPYLAAATAAAPAPPASARRRSGQKEFRKKKSTAPQSNARPGFAAALGSASRA